VMSVDAQPRRRRDRIALHRRDQIGAIGADTLRQAVAAIADALREMGVRRFAHE